jgi:Uma2 family endonuclease
MSATTPNVGAAKALMTADAFWEFVHRPENENRCFHLIRGEVTEVSRPTHPHGRVCLRVGFLLEAYAERTGRGYVVTESGVVLSESPATVVGPDVALYDDVQKFEDLHPKWGDVPPRTGRRGVVPE